jgi:hypothetical protein
MDKKLWTAIQELLDEAEYAVTVLDRYQDFEDDPHDLSPSPNPAMLAHHHLKEAAERVEKLMPEDPETPLETAIARAEYEEDR